MIPGCETSGRSGTVVDFTHIITTFWGSFASVMGGVGSFGGWCWFIRRVVDSEALMHDVFGCLFSNSASSTDGVYCAPYFVQPVPELMMVATSQTINRRLLFP